MSKTPSLIWKYFSKEKNSKLKARCTYCSKVIAMSHGSTGNLSRHLKQVHKMHSLREESITEKQIKSEFLEQTAFIEKALLFEVGEDPNMNFEVDMVESILVEGVENSSVEVIENAGPILVEEVENGNEETRVTRSLNSHDVSKRKRSTVWNHFSIVQHGGKKARCKYCQQIFSMKGSSANLARHLKLKHHGKDENMLSEVNSEEKILAEEVKNDHVENTGPILAEKVENDNVESVENISPMLAEEVENDNVESEENTGPILAEEVENGNKETMVMHSFNNQNASKRHSTVWNHFSVLADGGKRAECKYCLRVISFRGSTANLLRHLRLKHRGDSILGDHMQITNHKSVSDDESANFNGNIEITVMRDGRNIKRSCRVIRVMNCENDSRGDEGKKCLQNTSSEDKILLQPFNYIEQVPGKQIRTKLTKAFNHWLSIPPEKCEAVGEIVQMLHNASLLIDDIEDNSILRRGVPVAHNIFGVASTINSANYVYFLGLEKTLKLDHPKATSVFTEQLLELHRGQGMEIYWRDNFICPTEEEYKTMVKKKTGGLFGLGVQLMQLFSENQSDFSKIIGLVGLFFQIRDDYANLKSQKYTENKSYCEDLTEGKFSFPIIHSIKNNPEDPRIMNIVRQRPTDVEIKKYAVQLMEKFGSFKHCREILAMLDQEARDEIEALGSNSYLLTVLDELNINSI